MELFEQLLSGNSDHSESEEFRPWVLIHRTTYWLNRYHFLDYPITEFRKFFYDRDEKYDLKPNAMEAALSDIEECLKITSGV